MGDGASSFGFEAATTEAAAAAGAGDDFF